MAVVIAALAAAGCGTESISVPEDDPARTGGVLFSERCAGCHTLKAAGTQGSANRSQRQQGPNFDQRQVTYEDALYAIQNGGFSGAIMPQNIVVGSEAESVARFLEQYSGADAEEEPRPGASGS